MALGSISSDREPLKPAEGGEPAAVKPTHKKNPWKREEDALLLRLKTEGFTYSDIALQIPGRSSKQCRERSTLYFTSSRSFFISVIRWTSALNPQLTRTDFTEEEDQMICNIVAKEGPRWARLEREFNSRYLSLVFFSSVIPIPCCRRAANSIKNRFNNRLKDSAMFRAAQRRLGLPSAEEPEKPANNIPESAPAPAEPPPSPRVIPSLPANVQASTLKREQQNEEFFQSLGMILIPFFQKPSHLI